MCSVPGSKSSKSKRNPVNAHLFNTMVDRFQPGFLTELGRRIEPVQQERTRVAFTTQFDDSIELAQPKIVTEPQNL